MNETIIKELEKYKGTKVTIFYQAFGSDTFLGTLQNAYKNDKNEYIIDIIPYKCRKPTKLNLKTSDFVIYEGYRDIYFARGGLGLPMYEYFKKISTLKYPVLFKNITFEGVMYKGYAIIREHPNTKYCIIINGGGYVFNTIEEGKDYIDKFLIAEQKRIEEWRKRKS